jgi:nucleoid-associated protein YgaU
VAAIVGPVARSPRRALVAVGASALAILLVLAAFLGQGNARPDPTLPAVAASTAALPTLAGASIDVSPPPDGSRRYRVREGDTLRTIADRFGITVRQLRQANDLGDPPRLEPGDVLRIPPG